MYELLLGQSFSFPFVDEWPTGQDSRSFPVQSQVALVEDTQQQGPAEPKSRPGEYCKVKTGEVTLCIHSHDWVSIEFLIFLLQAMMDDKSEPLNYYAAYSEVKKLVI